MSSIKTRGFASMDPETRRIVQSRGGKSAHARGNAHTWTKEEASKAGKISRMKPRTSKALYELMRPNSTIIRRGFASMDKEKQRLIAGRGGKSAQAQGNAHTWTKEEASKAGKIGRMKPRTPKTLYELMRPNSTRSRLLTLLQEYLVQRPNSAITFVTLANELGASRQHVRYLYHQLKRAYRVPPMGRKGSAANEQHKRHILTRTTSKARHRSRL